MSILRTREQQIATRAANCISEVKKEEKLAKRYGTLARKLPSLVLTNGLGQTLAFLKSKGYSQGTPKPDAAEALIYKHLCGHLLTSKDSDLLDTIMGENSLEYRYHTAEALAFAGWLKRFAEAELEAEEAA